MHKKNKRANSKAEKKIVNLEQDIVELLRQSPGKAYSIKQISRKLHIQQKHLKNNIEKILLSKVRSGDFVLDDKGRFYLSGATSEITGVVDYVNARFAYIISDEMDQDVYVRAEDLANSLDDDTVKVKISSVRKDGRPVGRVTEIVKRNRLEFVGRIEISKGYAFVVPDFKKMFHDIFIRSEGIGKARNNDKVIVRIVDWKPGDKNPLGKVVKILGQAGEHEAEIHSIMAEFGLPFEFPGDVVAASEGIPDEITSMEIKKRRDFRKVTTFTIDPEDAKDFDDAISLKMLKSGHVEVGVHIADVSHYVQPDSPVDREAFNRATSVYLVDRTIPMLPERLSNNLCSLRPEEDKLTYSAVFELTPESEIVHEWFGKTIIHSDRRFTYEEAQDRLENQKGDFSKELQILNDLAHKLRRDRFSKGSINFETTEFKFELDEGGKPLGLVPKIRKDAHKLVEDFMLLANKRVAEFVYNRARKNNRTDTFVYRIHDEPDLEKLETFSRFAAKFGHRLEIGSKGISAALNMLMDEIEGKPEQNVLENLAIRSMAKAKYSVQEKGHFGLAFPQYTHFTSPIRRYPDLMVHRLLTHYLQEGAPVSREEYEKKCLHSSEMEKNAADAERASIKYKQVEFMASRVGYDFEGLVSGLTDWGIYVEIIETKVEGMIRMADLLDDYYEFDEKNMRVVGRGNKRVFTLGDKVKVRVMRADIDRRIIDLGMVDYE